MKILKHISCSLLLIVSLTSCVDLLDQPATVNLDAEKFWKTVDDATYALNGAYAATRKCFDMDYFFDGQGEFVCARDNPSDGGPIYDNDAYYKGSYTPKGYGDDFNRYYRSCYGAINYCNYVIENVAQMADRYPASKHELDVIVAEARLLRGMLYFRLIAMYGHVVYFDKVVVSEAEASTATRQDIRIVKQKIMDDFTYAYETLDETPVTPERASKWAALAFRGKLHLYWACWNRTQWPWNPQEGGGWPELDGFVANNDESRQSYEDARDDFKKLIDEAPYSLYKNGEPGDIDEMGKADILPNYFYQFIPTANHNEEVIMGFAHGGPSTDQSEMLMRVFGNRATESAQIWIQPYAETVNRYQSTITGDFCEPVVLKKDATLKNGSINPQTYADRDYRLKASMLWDNEVMVGLFDLKADGFRRFVFKKTSGSVDGIEVINSSQAKTGLIPRKFVRNYPGAARNEGDFFYPVMRLADVYLMYAEASNEMDGPTDFAVDLVNKIRRKGNLPALKPEKHATKEDFFDAIEQERIVELMFEGYRSFDLRRWRMMTKVWGPFQGEGKRFYSTHGQQIYHYFNNASDLDYKRLYIFKIPQEERDRNPQLTQNTPWL